MPPAADKSRQEWGAGGARCRAIDVPGADLGEPTTAYCVADAFGADDMIKQRNKVRELFATIGLMAG